MTIKEDLDLIQNWCEIWHDKEAVSAVGRIRAFVDSSIKARLSRSLADWDAFQRAHGIVAPLRSGEAPEILTPAEHVAQSWAAIQGWLDAEGAAFRHISVERDELGAFVTLFTELTIEYSGPRSTSRADALAQAAQWCLTEGAAS